MRAVDSSDHVLIGMGSSITAVRLGANLIEILEVIREARYTDTSGVLWSKDPRIVVALHTVTLLVPEIYMQRIKSFHSDRSIQA